MDQTENPTPPEQSTTPTGQQLVTEQNSLPATPMLSPEAPQIPTSQPPVASEPNIQNQPQPIANSTEPATPSGSMFETNVTPQAAREQLAATPVMQEPTIDGSHSQKKFPALYILVGVLVVIALLGFFVYLFAR